MKCITRMKSVALMVAAVFVCASLQLAAQQHAGLDILPFEKVAPRPAQFPLKTDRMLYTDEEIAMARRNVATYPGAKRIADRIIKAADYWIDWEDQDIIDVMAGAEVPRAFALSALG